MNNSSLRKKYSRNRRLKITLFANCGIGAHGYGMRVQPIAQEAVNRKYKVDIFCRNYVQKIKGVNYLKPLPLAKIIDNVLQGIFYYVSSHKYIAYLLEGYRNLFDKCSARKLKKGDIFHSWYYSTHSLKKAKALGMITFLECPTGHSAGLKKLFPHVKELGAHMPKEEIESYKITDYILAGSEVVKDSLIAGGVNSQKIIVCPYGYNRKLFYQDEMYKKKNKFRILFVGMIRERKDVGLLLEAVKQLGKKDIEVVLCGIIDHNYRKVIDKYRDKISLKTIGFISHNKLRAIYNSADIFVFPSWCEGSAKATYEAMACGLPLITTYNAGTVVRDGKDGFIIPVRDLSALKEKILFFYNNPKEIMRMGDKAVKRVRDFTFQEYGKRIVDEYEKVITT